MSHQLLKPLSADRNLLQTAFHDAHSGHIVGWSPTSVFVQKMNSGTVVTDRNFSGVACDDGLTVQSIQAAAVNRVSDVAMIASVVASRGGGSQTFPSRLCFVKGLSIWHTSPPLAESADLVEENATTCLVVLEASPVAVFSVAHSTGHRLHIYTPRRDGSHNVFQTIALPGRLRGLVAGLSPSTVVAYLVTGEVLIVRVHATADEVTSNVIASFDYGSDLIINVACSKSLIWVATKDLRLMALTTTAAGTEAEDSSMQLREVRFSRSDQAEGNAPATLLSGFTVGTDGDDNSTLLWADRSCDMALMCRPVVVEADGSLELDIVTVKVAPLLTTDAVYQVNSTASLQIPIANVWGCRTEGITSLAITRGRAWDALILRRPSAAPATVQRVVLPQAHADLAVARVAALPPPPAIKCTQSLSSRVTWSPSAQLGFLRTESERELQNLEVSSGEQRQDASLSSSTTAANDALTTEASLRSALERLIALQHTALAFLKRESAEAVAHDNGIAHGLLGRIRTVYVRLTCRQFVLRTLSRRVGNEAGVTEMATKPLAVLLAVDSCRTLRQQALTAIRREFLSTFQLDETFESHVERLERWGSASQSYEGAMPQQRLAFDVLVEASGCIDPQRHSLLDCIAFYPARIDGSLLAEILFYALASDDTSHIDELIRSLGVRRSVATWSQIAYTADHIDAATTYELLDQAHQSTEGVPHLARMLQHIVDGFVCRGEFHEAIICVRLALSVFPTALPNSLTAKGLFLAFIRADPALVHMIAQRAAMTSGDFGPRQLTGTQRLAARVVALVAKRIESLMLLDGFYDAQALECSIVESTLREPTSTSSPYVDASLLSQWALATGRVHLAYALSDGMTHMAYASEDGHLSRSAAAQKALRAKEHIRAHIISDQSDIPAGSSACVASELPSPAEPSPPIMLHQSQHPLSLSDAALDEAWLRATAGNPSAISYSASSRRGQSATVAASQGRLGNALSVRGSHVFFDTLASAPSAPPLCGVKGHVGGACGHPRPCPFHDADGRI